MAEKFKVTFKYLECDASSFAERACQQAQEWSARFPKRARPVRIKLGRNIIECTVTTEIDSNITAHTLFIQRKESSHDTESVDVSTVARDEEIEPDE